MVILVPNSNGEDNRPLWEFNKCHEPATGRFCSTGAEWAWQLPGADPDQFPQRSYDEAAAFVEQYAPLRGATPVPPPEDLGGLVEFRRRVSPGKTPEEADRRGMPFFVAVKGVPLKPLGSVPLTGPAGIPFHGDDAIQAARMIDNFGKQGLALPPPPPGAVLVFRVGGPQSTPEGHSVGDLYGVMDFIAGGEDFGIGSLPAGARLHAYHLFPPQGIVHVYNDSPVAFNRKTESRFYRV